MRNSTPIALVMQAACASSVPPVPKGPDLMETAEWSFVDAGTVDEVGETLPAHVTVAGSRFEYHDIGRTRAVRGAPGRIVVFCDLSGARYYTGEAMPVASGRGTVSVVFTVRRLRYQLGETIQHTDRVMLERDVFRWYSIDRGRALSTGPLETEALVTAARQGAQVEFGATPIRSNSVDVGLLGIPSSTGDRGVYHRFSLSGFASAMQRCG